jgi:acyl-CoA thioester hydrolase
MAQALDPATATSHHHVQVRFCETDLMGIVHHANYLVYAESARVNWLHRRGVSYESWAKHGVHLPVVETKLRFKKAAKFDDRVDIETVAAELSRVTVRFRYTMRCDSVLVCEAETLLACVGHNLKLKRMPAEVADTFRMAEV